MSHSAENLRLLFQVLDKQPTGNSPHIFHRRMRTAILEAKVEAFDYMSVLDEMLRNGWLSRQENEFIITPAGREKYTGL